MRRFIPYIIIAFLPAFFSCGQRNSSQSTEDAEIQKDTIYPLGFNTDTLAMEEGIVKQGDVFTGLLTRLGLDPVSANILAERCDSIFDPRKFRAGNLYRAYYHDADSLHRGDLHYLVYDESRISSIVFCCSDSLTGWRVAKPVEHCERFADVTITSSLWNDMRLQGASPLLILTLSDIYAWTVDFFGLQEGDRFRVLYNETVCEGETISVDDVSYAIFTSDGKDFPAIRYDQGDGGNVYWNDKGESMKKAFLKAPLSFSRISSGFTYHRKHPITRRVQPHTGVDYAAPSGTPVMSIGDGTVISAGYAGAGGNTVKIRHNSTYTTAYLHLSKYAKGIKAGQKVRQGQVIGYVGSTGRSTGPHLDFRVWKNGSPVNPLKMESPSAEPLKKENLPLLDSVARSYRQKIDSLTVKTKEML